MLKCLLIGLLLVISPCRADGVSDFNHKLIIADKLRSSDPTVFNRLVSELSAKRDSLSPRQQYYLDYLTLYQLTFQGKLEQALVAARQLVNSEADYLIKFRTNLTMVNIFAIAQNWNDGLSHLSDALAVLPSIKDEEMYQFGLIVSAIFYNQLGQYELGYSYGQQLKTRMLLERNQCVTNHLLLEAKFKLAEITEDSAEIQQGIDSCERAGENMIVVRIRAYLGSLYIDNGDYTKAIDFLLANLDLAEKAQYPRYVAIFYSLLAKAYWQEGVFDQAEIYANKTLLQAKGGRSAEHIAVAYGILYQLAEQNQDYKSAFEYHQKFAVAEKAYLDQVKTKHLAFQLAQHTALAQKSEIELFKQQNKLLKSEKQLAMTDARNNQLIIVLLAIIMTLLVFWIYKSRVVRGRLTVLAQYDDLTGAYSRGHFTEVALSAITYCQKTEQELSCIMFDLDHFKAVNDSHGHGCGDWVLRKVVEQCRGAIRKNDIFARIGGEEFCVILPGCSLQLAAKLAERCRQAITDIDTSASGAEFNVSASFGVTSITHSGLHLEKIMADADGAMYKSKKAGRNRVTKFRLTQSPLARMLDSTVDDIANIASGRSPD